MKRLLGLSLAILASNAATPPVKISLTSSWPAPPVVPEILETVALINPDGFFPLLDKLTDPKSLIFAQSAAPEALYQSGITTAVSNGIIQGASQVAEVQMNLALHAATPKLEAFYQHYEDRHNSSKGTTCGSWVDWYGEVICDIETLVQLVGHDTIDSSEESNTESTYVRPRILTFDHIYPPPSQTLDRPRRTAILYATLDSGNFRQLHSFLYAQANRPVPHVEYVLRYVLPQGPKSARNNLSGYGVALDLKKMDYLAVDDRFSSNKKSGEKYEQVENGESIPEIDPIISLIQAHPESDTPSDAKTPLTQQELGTLGLKAVQLIAESSEPLTALTHLSQNFPKYAKSLARRVIVNDSISSELATNAMRAQGGFNLFWLNGAQVDSKDINVFGLLGLLKKEKVLMKSLVNLGLEADNAIKLLTSSIIGKQQKESGVVDGLFDASDRNENGGVVVWWNDIEKDSRYARWSTSLYALLRPSYPGALPNVKANLFNVVLVVDLLDSANVDFIAGTVANIVDRGVPFRFGVVPMVDDEDSLKMARLFYHLIQKYGRKKTLGFLSMVTQSDSPVANFASSTKIEFKQIKAAYDSFILYIKQEEDPEHVAEDLNDILNGITEAEDKSDDLVTEEEGKEEDGKENVNGLKKGTPVEKIKLYTKRLSVKSSSGKGHVFFNGRYLTLDDDFIRNLQIEAGKQMQHLQEKIYEGAISDDKSPDMGNYFYDLPTTSKRRNRYIVPSTNNLKIVNLPEVFGKTGVEKEVTGGSYLYLDTSEILTSTVYVIADFDTEEGKSILVEAIGSLVKGSRKRLTFLHNPIDASLSSSDRKKTSTSWILSHLITSHTLSKVTPELLLSALNLSGVTQAAEGEQKQKAFGSADADALIKITGGVKLNEIDGSKYEKYVKASRLTSKALGIKVGEVGVIINGRVITPIEQSQFQSADFLALEDYEYKKRQVPIIEALTNVKPSVLELDKTSYVDLVSMVTAVISASQQPDPSEIGLFDAPVRPRTRSYRTLESEYTAFEFGDDSTALYQIGVVLDPLSPTAQKWSSILRWLSTIPDVFIEVHLNPARTYSDIPLKRFYRYNALSSLSFDEAGNEVPAQVIFEDLPIDPIYTLAMDVPSSWLVRPREALYDLDNILLNQLSEGDTSVDAIFALDYLVIEGHARETLTQAAPRGVQLELITSDGTAIDDTLVVANLGYTQFKAKPGVFRLRIRDGPGRDIFKMESVGNEGWDSPNVDEGGDEITCVGFEGLVLYPRLERLPGMEDVDVLDVEMNGNDDSDGEKGILESLTDTVWEFFGTKKKDELEVEVENGLVEVKKQADINIFTVASGLLYERFASIMILSVLRNTNSTVKFWFIENFLSPSFLEFIPHMAEKYNFQYELVTYKWPSWLRAQTEKQRIIWAYKILFLDVLFPMDLKKVIFVDADQIVRADLKELVDLNLHGAPYAYTPMGDDNTEMEGFRFWKTGYWKDFLQGRPYHISALYVIDLVKFRQMTAGDILRGQYHHLSADPNSLANLDQDLPNNLQKQVPIYSLPEDWLWCETWCSKDRLHRAKTIDLCQNPLTKEPKLSRARQIPEWEEYDAEIARFSRELAEEGKIHSRLATAGADVLASAGAIKDGDSVKGEEEKSDGEGDVKVEEVQRDEL